MWAWRGCRALVQRRGPRQCRACRSGFRGTSPRTYRRVNLNCDEVGHSVGYLLDNGGRNHFAGTAPCGEAVQNDEGVFVLERLLVVVHPVNAFVSRLFLRPMTSPSRSRWQLRHGGMSTYDWRLCTPCFCSLILLVVVKNWGVRSGR
jgi:hypothetical protein